MVGSQTWRVICVASALLAFGACSDRRGVSQQLEGEPLLEAMPGDAAGQLLAALQARYRYRPPQAWGLGFYGGASSARAISTHPSALPSGRATHFELTATDVLPRFLGNSATELRLPRAANGNLHIRDKRSGVDVRARLLAASAVQGTPTGGYVVYPGAAQGKHSVLLHPNEHGVEDYIQFDSEPQNAELAYQIELAGGVAGLRLVSNTLEFIDLAGSPSLRVAPPYLFDADGRRVPVTLEVEGCNVDRDPRPPWDRAPVAPGAQSCRVWLNWAGQTVKYPALLDPAWNSTGALANARSGTAAVRLPTGLVLVVGGSAADQGSCLDSAELYNPVTRSFAATGSLAVGRCRHAVVRRANGQVIITGGVDTDGTALDSTELYDSDLGTWASGAPMRFARSDHQAVLLNSGDVLIAGGTVDSAEKLSNASSTWSAAGSLLSSATEHSLAVLADGRVLLLGGAQAQLYVPASNNWYPAPAPLVDFLQGHAAVRLGNGQVLVVGAQSPSTELFDSNSDAWSSAPALLAPRYGHTATLLADGRVLVTGGLAASDSPDLSSELYDPKWGTFSPATSLVTPRTAHSAVLLATGRVLIVGGIDANHDTLSSAEEFDPAALDTVTTEYKLPARVDDAVLADRMTELWASVTRPSSLANGKRYPLVLFLHGNHGTCGIGTNPRHDYSCQYTDSGTCPRGYVVTPNHRGYDYVTSALAARGYIVVSINANRGINCAGGVSDDWGLNLARGRLILRHLEQLSAWKRGVSATPSSLGFSLVNRLDLQQVGLVGHSRGGEGVRAAYQQYLDLDSPWPARIVEPVTFRAIYEIGPVDGQSSRVLNADGVRWNVLLPMCDGDVSDLQGVRPFDRMLNTYSPPNPAVQSTYTVWGANHNFYNTEWQDSDSGGCTDHRPLFSATASGSAEQRQTALRSITEFLLANVGQPAVPALADLFNPEKNVPFDSPVERGYGAGQTPTMTLRLEDFDQRSGFSTFNVQNGHSRVTVTHGAVPGHDSALRAATVRWQSAGPSTYLQTNFTQAGLGLSLGAYDLLDFRVGRAQDPLNIEASTRFRVQLVNPDGSLSRGVSVAGYTDGIVGPVGGPYGNYHQMLSTIRIPLRDFENANPNAVRGVRFTFDETPTGVIYLANVRATRSTLQSGSSLAVSPKAKADMTAPVVTTSPVTPGTRAVSLSRKITSGNQVVSMTALASLGKIELTVSSTTPFLPRDSLLVIDIGAQRGVLGYHPAGDLRRAVFMIDRTAFDAAASGDRLVVHYERGGGDTWEFGSLDKRRLDQ